MYDTTSDRQNGLNGQPFYTADTGAVFIPLPRSMWRPIDGGCSCTECKAHPNPEGAFWDTAVIPGKNDKQPWVFTVHMPELQRRTPDWLLRGRRDYVF